MKRRILVNIRRFISLPDLFPLAPTNCPWVSEDGFNRTPPDDRVVTWKGFFLLRQEKITLMKD